MIIRTALFSACCALVVQAVAAQPQVTAPTLESPGSTPARFSLSPAGARALGLGGAFVAVADDATAADSNPAGLAQIERPQALVSLRSVSFDTEFSGGLSPGKVTGEESVGGPAFVGYVHPMGTITYAFYYQRDAEFESGARFEEGPFFIEFEPYNIVDLRRYEQQLETLGVAAAGRVGPSLSVGGSLRYQRLSVEWEDDLFLDFARFRPPSFGYPPIAESRSAVDDDSSDLTLVVGLLVHPEGRWKGGLSYQQGGDFALAADARFRRFGFPVLLYEIDLELPDVVSAGASFEPRERWLVSGQVSHVTYSDLGKEPRFLFVEPGTFIPTSPFFGDEPADDEIELHLGTEFRMGPVERPLALRAGLWTEPDHDTIRAIDTNQTHLALGAGKTLGKGWGLDGAVRFGETVKEGLLALSFSL